MLVPEITNEKQGVRTSWLWLLVMHGVTWVPSSGSYFYHCALYNKNQCFGGYENYAAAFSYLIFIIFLIVTVLFTVLNLSGKGRAAKSIAIFFSWLGILWALYVVAIFFLNIMVNPKNLEYFFRTAFLNDWARRLGFTGLFFSALYLWRVLKRNETIMNHDDGLEKKAAYRLAKISIIILIIGAFFVPYPGSVYRKSGFFTPANPFVIR